MKSLCIFMLFLDLEKAFDLAIREFLWGLPHGFSGDPVKYLMTLGLSNADAARLVAELSGGGALLPRLGVDLGIAELLRSLHTNAWMRLTADSDYLCTRRGGRQGCRVGSIVFNLIYAIALHELRNELKEKGVLLRLPVASGAAPWDDPSGSAENPAEPFDAAFVDDETVCVVAHSAMALDSKISTTVDAVVKIFGKYGVKVNWGPGKSGAILQYRRAGSSKGNEQRRCADSGELRITLPKVAGAPFLQVARYFEHLGTHTQARRPWGHMRPDTERARI